MVQPEVNQPEKEREAPEVPGVPGQVTPLSLLERARANDAKAWRRLLELYQPLVQAWCGRAGLRGPDAEDVTQEVLAGVAAGLADFRRDRPGDTFRGWLRGITRNQVLVHFRRRQGKPQAEGGSDAWQHLQNLADPLPGPDTDEAEEAGELYRRALDLIRADFEEATWRAFWLTAIEGRSPPTLTAELNMSPAAIRQAKARVLRRLKEELGDLLV
jgi:RNA polymerase sigma-70 factor (ECF subfamily)